MAKDRSVEITSSSPDFKDLEGEITRALRKALVIMNKDNSVLEVGLLTEEKMAKINKQYRNKTGPTNVLSFPEPEEIPHKDNYLGEIYLCPPVIKEREEDIIYLSIHGFLHLLGYTHKNKSDTIEMEKKEDGIMKQL